MLEKLHNRLENDILFILNCPGDLHETYLSNWKADPEPHEEQNVQTLHLRENWSAPASFAGKCSATAANGKPCFQTALQIPKGFVDVPVQKMAEGLAYTARGTTLGQELKFLKIYRATRLEGRREPEYMEVVGSAKDHSLQRGA